MDIPGFVFVIIGVLVAGLSVYINVSQGSAAMTLFIIAGTILVAWGVIKIIMQKGKGEGRLAGYSAQQQQQYDKQQYSPQQQQYRQSQQQPVQQQQWQRYKRQ
ncbi:hypothetical protein HYV82_03540 [Candidatus Woesearchaeota archaeon]|nr:hypothetical protein [Candidatus Woesearchaeota archaeon]